MPPTRGAESPRGPLGVPGPRDIPEEEVPLIGVGRVEFHRELNGLGRRVEAKVGNACRNGEETVGWICLSLAFWLFLTGYCALKGDWRVGR